MTHAFNRLFLLLVLALNTNYGLLEAQSPPRLVVAVVVDQMRYDYLHRFKAQFGPDGFNKLVNEGFSCYNAHFNYVPTFTAPGHASLFTGLTPSGHGIIGNNWLDRKTRQMVYCTGDASVFTVGSTSTAGKMSPKNLLAPTIGDRLKEARGDGAKVIGISLKDRGAILPAGKKANAAYWYDSESGNWISSTYYMNELPEWVDQFNQRRMPEKYLARMWNTLYPIQQYAESHPDDSDCEDLFTGKKQAVFPYDLHSLMKQNGGLDFLRETPFGNTFIREFACEAINREALGRDSVTDFLSISFSSTDYIGHQFGPDSKEVEDTYLRLDMEIAELIRFLNEQVGEKNYLLVLTADHGAPPAVNCSKRNGYDAGLISSKALRDSLRTFFRRTYRDTFLIQFNEFDFYLDTTRISRKKLDLAVVRTSAAAYLLKQAGIARVFTDFSGAAGTSVDSLEMKVRSGHFEGRSGDLTLILKPYWLIDYPRGCQHGSPYTYDTHVPMIFYGGGIKRGGTREYVPVTSMVPTLLRIMNLPEPDPDMTIQPFHGKAIKALVK